MAFYQTRAELCGDGGRGFGYLGLLSNVEMTDVILTRMYEGKSVCLDF